ncbi:hypothetical protein DSM25559_1854 [Agrobacterium rosae]|uniref:Uncharacterized protein n=1 Tax=Agrobacterium rosae TaxID=1972867 RepID=A0A1R3TLN2_9HYPH|nr:hypothetical protein DSM25559_1854 [Agrobacterium rosae]
MNSVVIRIVNQLVLVYVLKFVLQVNIFAVVNIVI